jgi:protoheme IX farnesyltransferase
MIRRLTILLELTKFRISLFATLSALAGFILAKQGISKEMVMPILGIFFLACGSCGFNQYQERENDKLMKRTKRRPIPSKRLHASAALKISLFLLLFGAFILYQGGNWTALGLGTFGILWYNGAYTPLKRRTAFASIPGALIGAVPPLFGWVSGGGDLFDPQILAIAFFFFIWQVPHFWLLFLEFGEDYEKAGFPSLTRIFSPAQLRRMIFTWIFATGVTCLIMPLFGMVGSRVVQMGFFLAGVWLVWKGVRLLRSSLPEFSFHFIFKAINSHVLLVMILLALDHLF